MNVARRGAGVVVHEGNLRLVFKGVVHKNKKTSCPQAIQDEDELVSLLELQHYMTCLPEDPL